MTSRTRKPRLDLFLREVPGQSYEMHEVLVRLAGGQQRPCGGYAIRRDDDGIAAGSRGRWWVGLAWSDQPEHGPYRTLASARKTIVTEQVLTPILAEKGWTS